MKRIIFNLKRKWYDKIAAGEKTVEYRRICDHWIKRLGFVRAFAVHSDWTEEEEVRNMETIEDIVREMREKSQVKSVYGERPWWAVLCGSYADRIESATASLRHENAKLKAAKKENENEYQNHA